MRATIGVPMLAVICSGCLFGGGGSGKNGDPNNTTSNNTTANNTTANNVTTGQNNTTTADMGPGPVDDMPVEASYGDLETNEVACAAPRTLWLSPSGPVPLNESSRVALAPPPRDVAVGLGAEGDVGQTTLAFATKSDAGIGVLVGTFDEGTGGALTPVMVQAAALGGTTAELLDIHVSAHFFLRNQLNPIAPVFTVTVLTSERSHECTFTLDMEDVQTFSCDRAPLNGVLEMHSLPPVARMDVAPILRPVEGRYRYSLLQSAAVALGSGTDGTDEVLFAFQGEADTPPERIAIDGAADRVARPDTFLERLVFGVEEASYGFPLIVALTAEAGQPPRPVALAAGNGFGTRYAPVDRGDWQLSSRVDARPGRFTFVDSYDVEATLAVAAVAYDFSPGEVDLGYVGVDDTGGNLIFSRPGGFGGSDFLELPFPDLQEVASFKNIPLERGSSGRAGLAVLHGTASDRLALINWDGGLQASFVADALGTGFSGARDLGAPWFVSDRGAVVMLAERMGTPVVAVVRIPDFDDLAQTCR